jgi:type I restriction enzyme, S subunit
LRAAYLQESGFIMNTPDRFLTHSTEKFGSKIAQVGDVIITTTGNSTGRVGRIREPQAASVYSPHLSYWRSKRPDQIDQGFLFYWSMSPDFRTQLAGMAGSTDMAPYLSLGDQMRLRISLPPLGGQRAIASILGVLDDKMDLNRRLNETLEAMARALFKDWFVDFGPTRAKMEGRAPYLAREIRALFPDRLDNEDKPEGWQIASLGDYANLNPESWSRANYPSRINYVDLSGTKWGKIETIEPYDRERAPSRAQRVLRPGDTIIGTVRPGNGSYAFVSEDGLTGSTGFAVLRPTRRYTREFVYLAASYQSNIERLAHLADGAAYPAVRPEVVRATEVALVGESLLKAFCAVTAPLIDRMEANKKESQTLAASRDLLLPRLMSGKIRVKEAEKEVQAVP